MANGSVSDARDALKPSPARRSRGWVWFFLLLGALTVAAVTTNWWYNVRQQLTPEKLAAAKALWAKHGPRDYDLKWTKQLAVKETIEARVRGGKVVSAKLDGRELEPRLYAYYDMEGLFDFVEQFLDKDRQPNSPRTFAVARFDQTDGHLMRYVRSVSTTRERVEILVQLRPASGDAMP